MKTNAVLLSIKAELTFNSNDKHTEMLKWECLNESKSECC